MIDPEKSENDDKLTTAERRARLAEVVEDWGKAAGPRNQGPEAAIWFTRGP